MLLKAFHGFEGNWHLLSYAIFVIFKCTAFILKNVSLCLSTHPFQEQKDHNFVIRSFLGNCCDTRPPAKIRVY